LKRKRTDDGDSDVTELVESMTTEDEKDKHKKKQLKDTTSRKRRTRMVVNRRHD